MEERSRKVTATCERTKRAFMELAGEKKIDKISVKELTARAGINRSTFYAHYEDIYDLKEQVLEGFRAFMQEQVLPLVVDIVYGRDMEQVSYRIIEIFKENKLLYKAFLVNNRDDAMVEEFKNIAMDTLKGRFSGMGMTPPAELEYILEYLVAGHLALLSLWAKDENTLPVEKLVPLTRDLNYYGPVHCLFNTNK